MLSRRHGIRQEDALSTPELRVQWARAPSAGSAAGVWLGRERVLLHEPLGRGLPPPSHHSRVALVGGGCPHDAGGRGYPTAGKEGGRGGGATD